MNNPLSIALANIMGSGGMSQQQQPEEHAPSRFPGMSKGQIIAGILADALAGAAGRPGPFGAMLDDRRKQQEDEINWGRRRQAELEDYERKQQIEQQYATSPMVRDANDWQRMTPQQKEAYQQMQGMRQGDPDVFVTLPNGQVYAGPKSGLSQALLGGGPTVQKPVGKLTPLNGGPTPQASGGFRY